VQWDWRELALPTTCWLACCCMTTLISLLLTQPIQRVLLAVAARLQAQECHGDRAAGEQGCADCGRPGHSQVSSSRAATLQMCSAAECIVYITAGVAASAVESTSIQTARLVASKLLLQSCCYTSFGFPPPAQSLLIVSYLRLLAGAHYHQPAAAAPHQPRSSRC
jgi:hypothetical protein